MVKELLRKSVTRMRPLLRAVLFVFAVALPAAAQDADTARLKPDAEDVRALAADYELRSADGTRTCAVALQARLGRYGLVVVFDQKRCSPLFAFLGDVAAWRPGIAGAILLVGRDGRVVAEFVEGVNGIYDAIRENDAVYFLANLKYVDVSQRIQVNDLFGEWNLSRPGGSPICRITLSDELLAEDTFAVQLLPGCDAAIERFRPQTWQLLFGDVVIRAENGDQLRFGRREDGVWARVPERPRPLLMTR